MSAQPHPTKLYQALLLALRDMGPVRKTATNPGFRSKYADLPSVLDTVDEPLHAHGLLVVQRLDSEMTTGLHTPLLITELIHAESGESMSSVVPLASKDPSDPQKFGSALTYYRRYSLLALLGLAPEDDDGNAASQPPRPPARANAPVASPAAPGRAETPAQAPQALAPAPPARKIQDWTHEELLAFAQDEAKNMTKRLAAARHYLLRAPTAFEVMAWARNLTTLHPDDVTGLRETALAELRAVMQPANHAD